MQHFEGETPLIAAVVKGRQFMVTAGAMEDAVEATEGLVEWRLEATCARRSFRPRALECAREGESSLRGSTTAPASNSGSITYTIGGEPIDYAMVMDGLVVVTPVAIGLTTTKNDGGSSATENGISAATAGSVDAVDLGIGAAGGVVADVDAGSGNASGGGGVAVRLDAGAGIGGGGGVGVVVDIGAGTGGGAGVGVGVTEGAGSGTGFGVGIGVVARRRVKPRMPVQAAAASALALVSTARKSATRRSKSVVLDVVRGPANQKRSRRPYLLICPRLARCLGAPKNVLRKPSAKPGRR